MSGSPWRDIASGIGFTEGPLWMPDGTLLVTSMSRGVLYRLRLDNAADAVVTTYETGGGPNGLALRSDGTVIIAQNGSTAFASRSERPALPGIQLLVDDEVLDVLTSDSAAPNDLLVAGDGTVWFTDPGSAAQLDFDSCVRRYDLETGALDTLTTDVSFPNGLAMGPDGAFYLADSVTNEILRYDVTDEGLSGRSVFTIVPEGGPDGIAFDKEGNLYVAAFESNDVVVFAPSGELVRSIPTGEASRPTNLCFAGVNLDQLVVTLASGGRVIALEERIEGWAL